jgi:hypothetical protein
MCSVSANRFSVTVHMVKVYTHEVKTKQLRKHTK